MRNGKLSAISRLRYCQGMGRGKSTTAQTATTMRRDGAATTALEHEYLPVGTRGLLELRVLDPVRAVGGTFTFAQQLRDVVNCVGNAGCALAAYEAADGAILLATDLELGQYGPGVFCIQREVARRLGLPAGQVICKSICPAPKRVEVIRRFPPRATVS